MESGDGKLSVNSISVIGPTRQLEGDAENQKSIHTTLNKQAPTAEALDPNRTPQLPRRRRPSISTSYHNGTPYHATILPPMQTTTTSSNPCYNANSTKWPIIFYQM